MVRKRALADRAEFTNVDVKSASFKRVMRVVGMYIKAGYYVYGTEHKLQGDRLVIDILCLKEKHKEETT